MGWKSTVDITREDALQLIRAELFRKLGVFEQLDNSEIEKLLYSLDYGDDPDLAYYGHNFNIL